jgi:hypothetical protein
MAEQPIARTRDLVLKAVGDELLVYDLTRHRAHSLNRVAAAVWERCDGTRDAPAIAAALRQAGGPPVTEAAVRYALAELGRARLLTGPVHEAGVTRRELMRRLGTAAAVTLPVVTSIAAPTPAQAQSPVCPSPDLQGTCAHSLCTTGTALTSGCDPCVTQICQEDSFCCNTGWDSICVNEVASVCGCGCPNGGGSGAAATSSTR